MTTRVTVSCPDDSHWHVKVTVRDKLFDPKSGRYVPDQFTRGESFILKQGESRDITIWDSRGLTIEEIVPEKAAEAV